jgi:hypothetical protein
MRRTFLKTLGSIALGTLSLGTMTTGAAVLSACLGGEDGGDTTTGKRVHLSTRAELAGGTEFTNAFGWSFTLTKVLVSSGALYYFDGEPLEPVARATEPRSLSLIGVAHAHPGHYKEGNTKGEMLVAASYDLVKGPAALAEGEGVSGLFRSARFTFESPAQGPMSAEMQVAVVIVEGTATKDGATKAFRLVGLVDDVLDADGLPNLDGCTFEETDVEDDGSVVVSIDPSVWLDQVQLDELPDGAVPVDVARDHSAFVSFARGLKKSTAYRFSYEP